MVVKLNPYPDELLYGWILRLAAANALPPQMFAEYYMGRENKYTPLLYDIREGFPLLAKEVFATDNFANKFFELSTAALYAIILTPQNQHRLICNVFEPLDDINKLLAGNIYKIQVCPDCIAEDTDMYGEPYLHRAHNIEGVKCCHKHHCSLYEFTGKKGAELQFTPENYVEISKDITPLDTQYAQYVQKLLSYNLQTNLKSIQKVLAQRGFEKGMVTSYNSKDMFEIRTNDSFFMPKELFYGDYVETYKFFRMMEMLFPNVDDFVKKLPVEPIVQQYECDCGKTYYQSKWGHDLGLRSCSCKPYANAHEKFIDMARQIKGAEYKVTGKFEGMTVGVDMIHTKCGFRHSYSPKNFLFGTSQCECETIVTFEEAKRKIENMSGYKLISFTKASESITIEAERCGHTFDCNYRKFLHFPNCRICHPGVMTQTAMEEKVKMLVGDEYTVVGAFISQKEKIKIRHNVCGSIQEYAPSGFLAGQRCKKCGCEISYNKLSEYLKSYSNGLYEIIKFGKNLTTIKNTSTNEIIKLAPQRILQEILRPTPSELLPVDNPNRDIKITSAWEDALNLFKEYTQTHAAIDITRTTFYKEFGLGNWVKAQRRAYNRGDLSETSIELLQQAGFIFEKQDEVWMQRYSILKDIYPQGLVTINTVVNGINIGYWLKNQKNAYSKGTLSWDRIDMLQQIDMNILLNRGSCHMLSTQNKHVRMHYDKNRNMLILYPNSYLSSFCSPEKTIRCETVDTIMNLYINLNKVTSDDLFQAGKYIKQNGFDIVINANDFYDATGLDIFIPPEKYHPEWYIDGGEMYTTTKEACDAVFNILSYGKQKESQVLS